MLITLYFRYIGKVGFDSDFDIEVSNIDISVFVLIFIQVSNNYLKIIMIRLQSLPSPLAIFFWDTGDS